MFPSQFATTFDVKLTPLLCLQHLTADQRQAEAAALSPRSRRRLKPKMRKKAARPWVLPPFWLKTHTASLQLTPKEYTTGPPAHATPAACDPLVFFSRADRTRGGARGVVGRAEDAIAGSGPSRASFMAGRPAFPDDRLHAGGGSIRMAGWGRQIEAVGEAEAPLGVGKARESAWPGRCCASRLSLGT